MKNIARYEIYVNGSLFYKGKCIPGNYPDVNDKKIKEVLIKGINCVCEYVYEEKIK